MAPKGRQQLGAKGGAFACAGAAGCIVGGQVLFASFSPQAEHTVRKGLRGDSQGSSQHSLPSVAEGPSTLAAGVGAAACLAACGAAATARSKRSRGTPSQRSGPSPVAVKAEQWQPRYSGWTPAELAAERQRVLSMPGPDASYSGPRYESAASITEDWIFGLLDMQQNGGIMPKRDLSLMVLDMIDLLSKESTLMEVTIPAGKTLTVCGDLHGQYWDFMNLLQLAGIPSADTPFLFNGDFVDRGSWSIEVITTLFAFKLKNPGSVYLNRGNHEMLEANILYGFCGECGSKYDMGLFDLFSEAFRNLPLCHLVDKKVLVLHAGLPGPQPRIWLPGQTHDPTDAIPMTKLATLQEIAAVDRYMEVTPESYVNSIGPETTDKALSDVRHIIDILWGDPRGGPDYGPSYRKSKGVYMYGPNVTNKFVTDNNLQCIIRSHEVKAEGYRWDHPNLITVFSAPNYLDTGNNKGSFLKLTHAPGSDKIDIEPVPFEAVPHPDLPPMHWQSLIANDYAHLTRKMRKKVSAVSFDEFGDSDFEGLMNFDEWEADEADAFQEAFQVDEFGRELSS